MAIRKKDLSEFIEKKANKRKTEMKEAVRVVVKVAFKPVVMAWFSEMDSIERQAAQLYEKLLDIHNLPHYCKSYTIRQAPSRTNDLVGWRESRLNEQVNLAMYNLLETGTNGLYNDLYPIVNDLEQQLASQIAEYKRFSKLTTEILAVISASRNGDKAYERLKELGVDLTDFEGSKVTLPAVIKLSEPVCVFNGDCQ